jgi:hypothetical protein
MGYNGFHDMATTRRNNPQKPPPKAVISRATIISCVLALALGGGLWFAFMGDPAVPPPEPFGDVKPFAAITAADLDANARALPAIQDEALRRLLAAGRYPGQTQGVLPEALRHLHAILTYETSLASPVVPLHSIVAMSRGPTPGYPPVSELIAAYPALNQPELVKAAEAFQEAVAANTLDQDAEQVSKRFRAAMAQPGLADQRRAYARSHRDDILPP